MHNFQKNMPENKKANSNNNSGNKLNMRAIVT